MTQLSKDREEFKVLLTAATDNTVVIWMRIAANQLESKATLTEDLEEYAKMMYSECTDEICRRFNIKESKGEE